MRAWGGRGSRGREGSKGSRGRIRISLKNSALVALESYPHPKPHTLNPTPYPNVSFGLDYFR